MEKTRLQKLDNLSHFLFEVVDLFESESIDYALIGGFAVSLIADERFTRDIDFTITFKPHQFNKFKNKLDESEYEIDFIDFNSSDQYPDFMRLKINNILVDLLIAQIDFQEEIISRAIEFKLLNKNIKVASPEDMIIMKLLADRPRDREDILSIINHHKNLDKQYLQKWSNYWEISEKLKKHFQ